MIYVIICFVIVFVVFFVLIGTQKYPLIFKQKKHKTFSDIITYVDVTDDLIIGMSPDRITAVLEVYFSEFDFEETLEGCHSNLMSILVNLPPNTTYSFYYCKTFLPTNPVLVGKSKHEIVRYMERDKYDYVKECPSPEFVTYLAITIPVVLEEDAGTFRVKKRKKQGLSKEDQAKDLVALIKGYKDAQKVMNMIIKQISAQMEGTTVIRLDRGRILQFLSLLLNHEYILGSDVKDLTDVLRSDWNICAPGMFDRTRSGSVVYGGNTHAVTSLRANMADSRIPGQTSPNMNMVFNHIDLRGVPYIIQHTFTIPPKDVGLSRAKRRLSMIANREGFAKYLKFLEKTPEGLPPEKLRVTVEEAIAVAEGGDAKFVEMFFHVHLWDKTFKSLDKRCSDFVSTVGMSYKMKREKFNIKSAYFSLLPGNEYLEKIRTTLVSTNVADFMPIDLPRWPYHAPKNKWELYYYNEVDSFSKVDLFDTRCANHNAIVVGASGSGKSFTEQDKLWQAMKYDPCVVIIDFGGEGQGSYKSLVKNLKGTYLEVSLNSPYSINPFAGEYYVWQELDNNGRVVGERPARIITKEGGEKVVEDGGVPNPLKHTSLMSTLERIFIGNSKDKDIPARVRTGVIKCIRDYYIVTDNNVDNVCSLSDFVDRYIKNPSQELSERLSGDWNLYDRVVDFIGDGSERGSYAQFFKKSDKIENDDVICFDMAGLKDHPALKVVMIPALLSMIMLNVLNNPKKRDRRKLVIMDEAWRELQGGDMAEFMQEMFRTIRKLNGQITIITQSIDDLLGSSSFNALIANTSYFWLIGGTHRPEALRQINAQGRGLSEYEIFVITHQQNKKEMYLLSPYYSGKFRFYPTAAFKMLATTAPDDKAVLDAVRRELGVDYTTPDVIERLKNHERFRTEHHAL